MDQEKIPLSVFVESLPPNETGWVEILGAMLTPTIAIVALVIAVLQYKINAQRLRHEMYERRLAVYKIVQRYFGEILQTGTVKFPQCVQFYGETSEATFLFDHKIPDWIEVVYKKSLQMARLQEEMYPSNGSPGVPVGEARTKVVKEFHELLEWHFSEMKKAKDLFQRYLNIR